MFPAFPPASRVPRPNFTFEAYQGADLVGGETVQFSQILAAGKPVVLNFWAAQCRPCRVEMPEFDHAWQAARDRVCWWDWMLAPSSSWVLVRKARRWPRSWA